MFGKEGHTAPKVNAKTFSEHLRAFAKFGLTAGILGLTAVSGLTTYEGFQSFLEGELSLVGAFSLHAVMFGMEVNSIHGKSGRARILSRLGLLVLIAISITFSYVGLRTIFTRHATEMQAPIYELDNLRQAQASLQQQAEEFRRGANAYLENEKSRNQKEYSLTQESHQARSSIAAQLRNKLSAARDAAGNRKPSALANDSGN